MRINNTLTRQKEELVSVDPNVIKIYACGPTVYDYIHIGNARPLCVFDCLRRYLSWSGKKVIFAQNFTDIDDKIINKANKENTSYDVISKRYINEYYVDAKGLNIIPSDITPLATENIDEIITLIGVLIKKGFAYKTSNGDVYFRTKKFENYGKLSRQPLEELNAGARIIVNDIKENPADFTLWKASKIGEPSWESPFSNGRPGWHIECSAMAIKYLGETIDIHCGGQDLLFPHHENEIAQSESATGKPFANFWMHNGYINVDNKKMGKSKNNFFTVRDVANVYGYETIRFFLISSHYSSPINYTEEIMAQSKNALYRLYNCKNNINFALKNSCDGEIDNKVINKLQFYEEEFAKALDDDLNTADALGILFELTKEINIILNTSLTQPTLQAINEKYLELSGILGLLHENDETKLDNEVEELIKQRDEARKNKDWATSDIIRDKLKLMKIVLEDTPQGVKWHKE